MYLCILDGLFFTLYSPGAMRWCTSLPVLVAADVCRHHVSCMQTAKLVLVSKRGANGGPPAAPLAFALRGEVDARGPLKRIKTSAQLYEFQEVEVKLTNPFQVLLLELGQPFQSVMHV